MNDFYAEGQLDKLNPDDSDKLFLRFKSRGTLYTQDILRKMEARNRSTVNVSGAEFINQFFEECTLATNEGYTVITTYFKSKVSIRGKVKLSKLGHTISTEDVTVKVNLEAGKSLDNFGQDRNIKIGKNLVSADPKVQKVQNPLILQPNELTSGGMVLIQGLNIAVRGDALDEIGIFYEDIEDGIVIRIPAEHIFPNTSTKLQHLLPATIRPGMYKVRVATQSGSRNGYTTRNIRTGEYEQLVAVL